MFLVSEIRVILRTMANISYSIFFHSPSRFSTVYTSGNSNHTHSPISSVQMKSNFITESQIIFYPTKYIVDVDLVVLCFAE